MNLTKSFRYHSLWLHFWLFEILQATQWLEDGRRFNQRFTERRTFQILIKVLVVIISISRAKFLFILEFVETAFSYWNEKIWRIWMKSWLFTWWQVVQEYERAVIFRLGRLRQGGAKVVLMIVIYYFKG